MAAPKEFLYERLDYRARPAGFWQLPCPHSRSAFSLQYCAIVPQLYAARLGSKSKKLGISRNLDDTGSANFFLVVVYVLSFATRLEGPDGPCRGPKERTERSSSLQAIP
jgi:hypothetical protein